MASTFYEYRNPSTTYTIDQFIACQSNTAVNHANISFSDIVDLMKYDAYCTLRDYIDEIKENYCSTIVISDKEMMRYKYRPKLLCYDIYGNEELAFIILIINDMYDARQFTKTTLFLPSKDNMREVCDSLYNANMDAIKKYESQ